LASDHPKTGGNEMILHRRLSGTALAVCVAAVAASPALARPIDAPVDRAETQVRVVEVPADEGFDLAGAGIGAGAMLMATGLGGALVLSIRRRHGRAATTA
jgi:hypothetical protein